MVNNLEAFTDRREAIVLFNAWRGRAPEKPWPLLPILVFLAPAGSGKSTLIEYLVTKECCLPDGQAALPYATLDFTRDDAPRDLLSILINIRDQLQLHADGSGRHLAFPRFDLGAAIAKSIPLDGNLPPLSQKEIRAQLSAALPAFGPLGEMGSALGNLGSYYAFIPPLIVGLKWLGQIPPLQEIVGRLEKGPGWRWYQQQSGDVGLRASKGIGDVLLRLYYLSIPGRPERESLIEQMLPAAFIADLLDALVSAHAWRSVANVVIFLDGFEGLLDNQATSKVAIRLLEGLVLTAHRERGETDPLLLVLGSRQRSLLDFVGVPQPSLREQTETFPEPDMHEWARKRSLLWEQQLPPYRSELALKDLYLPIWLHDFGLDDTRSYLTRMDTQSQPISALVDNKLIEALHRLTHGHPLSLALAVAVLRAAHARGHTVDVERIVEEAVSRKVVPGHEHETIAEYLIELFLRQLSESERTEIIFCSAPRALDAAVLRVLLQLPPGVEAQQQWKRYGRLTFASVVGDERLIFHPVVRMLLLRQLPVDSAPDSDYQRIHRLLKEHFHERATGGNQQARIEEAYHALALGDPDVAISIGIEAQQTNLDLWEPLLEAVDQAPVGLITPEMEEQAYAALVQAEQYHYAQFAITALILYQWLLCTQGTHERTAFLQHNLGLAYSNLPAGDRAVNLQQAIACYTAALEVYTQEAFPMQWATTQNNLGNAYQNLPAGDRAVNLQLAIACYTAALEVYTQEAFPIDWAMTQNNLGAAYQNLPAGDRAVNLQLAIACYTAALEVYTQEAFPIDWAGTQNNLGAAYQNLPTGEHETNLQQAIACYTAALDVYTREAFPMQWARTQNNLGIAYWNLPAGDRAVNLQHAIDYYTAALQVYTREAFPIDWAGTQNNLGNAYRDLPTGDRAVNLQHAIDCYTAALQVYTREAFPIDWAGTQNNLGTAYSNLPTGERAVNLQHAIACYTAALQVRTREAFPMQWAGTQNNLGNAYQNLPTGDRGANLQHAIECYTAALEVYTREAFPMQWAATQNNLGIAYSDLPAEDRAVNLQHAIDCYTAALQVRTREAFPIDWAGTHNNLGTAYSDLSAGERETNLQHAIDCYTAALQVRTRESFPMDWAMTQNNLGIAYQNLPTGERGANLQHAIDCFEEALQVYVLQRIDYYAQLVKENLEAVRQELQGLG